MWPKAKHFPRHRALGTNGFLAPLSFKRQTELMNLRLSPLELERFPAWQERSRQEYEADLLATGESSEDAHRHAMQAMDSEFPEGKPTEHNAVFDALDDSGNLVGYLWIGHDTTGDSQSWWVWDVLVEPDYRGQGLGRKIMELGELYAKSQGAKTLGLSVFGFNRTARGLYESMGYEATTLKMRKVL